MEKNSSYNVIAVVADGEDKKGRKGVRYNTPDLLNFQQFLDNNYPDWLWFNVYDKQGAQIGNFTKNKRATDKRIAQ